MATYCIGDIQGCFDELQQLLHIVNYDRDRDSLWFVGDLVNRGTKSLEVLRFIKQQQFITFRIILYHVLPQIRSESSVIFIKLFGNFFFLE